MSGLFDQVVNYSPPLLTSGQVNYDGTWNAATNTPTLVSPPDALSKGDYYVVSAAGTQFGISFAVGDWIISNGTAWEKVDLTDAVSSVFGRTGAVVGDSTDYSAVGITNTAIGAANPSTGAFTTVRALNNLGGYQTVVGQATGGDRVGIAGQASGTGGNIIFFDNTETIFRPGIIEGSSIALRISGTDRATVTSTGLQGALGATTPSTGAFTSLSSSSTTTLNGTTIPASKTLVVTTDKLSALAATTSAELAGVISDETGSGSLVFANSPTLVTPALGTPSALVGTNITGTAAAFNINGTVGATTPSTVAATSVTALSDSGYQAVVGQLTSGDRVGISGQASGSGTALVFFDNAQTTFRPAIFDASSHSLKISGVEKASVTSTGLQGAIGATTASTGAFTTVSATTPIAVASGGTGVSTSTGTTNVVLSNSPTLVTPNLGTPSAVVLTNASGTASININGTVGATTPSTVAATTGTFTDVLKVSPSNGFSQLQLMEGAGTTFGWRFLKLGPGDTALRLSNTADNFSAENTVATFTSTGLNSTAIGATTPSTAVFTTLHQGTAGAQGLNVGFSGAAGQGFTLRDTTNSRTYFVTTETATGLQINAGTNPISLIGSSVAVTGALSSTGNLTAGTSSGVSGRVEANGGSGQNGVGAYTPTAANSCVAMWNAASSGDNRFTTLFSDGSIIERGSIDYNRAANLVRYNVTSDQHLKTNIRDLTDAGAFIDRLQPRVFAWKEAGHKEHNTGFIAQEVYEVFPDAVSKGSDTFTESEGYKQWAMDAGKFMPLVIAELKSLRARVAALESN